MLPQSPHQSNFIAPLYATFQGLNTFPRLKNTSHQLTPLDVDLVVQVITLRQRDSYQPSCLLLTHVHPLALSPWAMTSLKLNMSDIIKVLLDPSLRVWRGVVKKYHQPLAWQKTPPGSWIQFGAIKWSVIQDWETDRKLEGGWCGGTVVNEEVNAPLPIFLF